ncbi:MAG: hypothetical protein JWM28_1701 [Chitinophagaceae bacterium]|nr:hypothetical protein [Chitinophagaceae bacterium]
MKNAVLRPLFEEPSRDAILAPVISIKSVRVESSKSKAGSVKTAADKTVPAFTGPVFKPKKHDMF